MIILYYLIKIHNAKIINAPTKNLLNCISIDYKILVFITNDISYKVNKSKK